MLWQFLRQQPITTHLHGQGTNMFTIPKIKFQQNKIFEQGDKLSRKLNCKVQVEIF